jgi:light-regulated signal transduction histidine kinase (bacteriophytochrome)
VAHSGIGANNLRLIGGIAEDITAQKERDAAIATTQQDLKRMVAERTTELEHANVELEAFSRTAAHDLKSPLNGVVGMSYLLKSRFGATLGEEGTDMVNQIESSSLRMAMLVNDLLALSRVTQVELKLQELDLVQMAHEVIEDLRRQSPHRTLLFVAPPALPVLCDAGLARSLMTNLLSNAWKFTANKPDARIALSATQSPSATSVTLEDNGAGFESSGAKNLFKPFQRFHSSSEFNGTGVGLVTCQRIVHRHGGDIQISSAPGVGTTVAFSMPRRAQVQEVPTPGRHA